MLDQLTRQQLNRMNGTAYKYALGSAVSNVVSCVKGTYDFTKQGGAIGSFNLLNDEGNIVQIPAGALILDAFFNVKTAATSGGLATLAFKAEGAGDLLAATAVASFTTAALLQGVPVSGTISSAVLTTAIRNLQLTVAVATLLTGKVQGFVSYVLT